MGKQNNDFDDEEYGRQMISAFGDIFKVIGGIILFILCASAWPLFIILIIAAFFIGTGPRFWE